MSPSTAQGASHGSTIAVMAMAPFLRLIREAGPERAERASAELVRRLARWGVPLSRVEADPTLRLPFALMAELAQTCIEVLDDPAAPLKAATRLRHDDYELLDFLVGSCATLGDAIDCMTRFYPLVADAEQELRVRGDVAELHFRFAPGLDAPPALYEFALASCFMKAVHHLRPEGSTPPLELRLRHPAPRHAPMFPVVFGCPARFDADSYATVFPARMLRQPMRSPNAVLHGVLRRQAEREVAALPSRSALPFAVRDLLAVQLERGPELSEVARALGMSGSSLRARLREHGTTFSELLDDLRKEQARQLLAARELSVAEVSRALGFAHAPALQRACQRWFGQSPGAYRQAQRRHPVAELLGRGG